MIDEKESQDDEEGEEEEEEVSIFVHRFFLYEVQCSDWDPGPFVGIRIGRVSCVQICQDPEK